MKYEYCLERGFVGVILCLSVRGEVCKTGVCTKYKPEFDYEPTYGCGSIPMRNTDTHASGDTRFPLGT